MNPNSNKIRFVLFILVSLLCHFAWAQEEVIIPTTVQKGFADLNGISAKLFLTEGAEGVKKPMVILLHGCGGAYQKNGLLSERMLEYTKLMNENGWNALVLDSFKSRHVRQICTEKYSNRTVTQGMRVQDVLDTMIFLSAQNYVDVDRIALIGWSNGASTVLAATNLNNSVIQSFNIKPKVAAIFYPGCNTDRKKGYSPSAPLLLQIGAVDDWTPPLPCRLMVQEASEPKPKMIEYENSYHGFDSLQTVKIRTDVPRGLVHYGGNPSANLESKKHLIAFFQSHLQP